MRILWHSTAPWQPTGYGTQTALWSRWLRDQGHEVALSAYYGNPGYTTEWEGMTVYASPMEANPDAIVMGHARRHEADLIILLCDVWILDPWRFDGPTPVLTWIPIDVAPLSIGDTNFVTQGPPNIRALAMSEHGREQLAAAGVKPVGVLPHGIDTTLFAPDPHRAELRAAFGIVAGQFAVGMNFNNIDPWRKSAAEQLRGFAEFHRRRPDSVLFVHSMAQVRGSLDLETVVRTLGITDAVRFCDQYRMRAGDYSDVDMVRWYNAMDVVLNATRGEGFGIPAIEAQACGTPVILSRNTTGPQLCGSSSLLVDTVPMYNPTHNAWWSTPIVSQISKALASIRLAGTTPAARRKARDFALQYDYRRIGPAWTEILSAAVA